MNNSRISTSTFGHGTPCAKRTAEDCSRFIVKATRDTVPERYDGFRASPPKLMDIEE